MWMPVYFEIIEQQNGDDPSGDYFYIVDTEVFINLGRVLGIISLLILMQFLSVNDALRVMPVLFAITQLPAIYFIRRTFEGLK